MRIPVELRRSYRLINHGPTTLMTSAHGDKRNVMAAAWAMPLDFDPARVAVVIAEGTFTRELVDASGEFALCIPTRDMAQATHDAGKATGRDQDKLDSLGFRSFPASKVAAPLLEGCAAWLECRVIPEPAMTGKYDLFVADIVAAWAEDSAFNGKEWTFENEDMRSIHHVAGGSFFETGKRTG